MASYIGVAPPTQTGIVERYQYTGDGSTVLFSGADNNGKTLRYTSTNPLLVTLNGVQLVEDTDYTKTSDTSVTFTSAPASNDDIEFLTFGSFDLNSPATLREDLGIELSSGQILYGNTSNQSAAYTLSGTSNEIEINTSSNTVTLGLPDDVTITGDLTVDTNTLYADSSNNRVGVGTTSPVSPLHVISGAVFQGSTSPTLPGNNLGALNINNNSSDGTLDFSQGIVFTDNVNSDSADQGAWTHAAIVSVGSSGFNGNLVFGTDGSGTRSSSNTSAITERMRITSEGYVGIGTSSPATALDIRSDGTSTDIVTFRSDLGTNDRSMVIRSPSSDSTTEPFVFQTGNSFAFVTDTDTVLTIADSRNVGIGTGNPQQKLHVSSGATNITARFQSSDAGAVIAFTDTGGSSWIGTNGSGEFAVATGGSANISANDATQNFTIDSSGNVGIGTTTPSYKLHVVGDAYVSTDLTVDGNLTINGTTTTVSSTNTQITDNLLELNSGATANTNDSGIIIERGSTGDNAIMAWDESADQFIFGTTTATASDTGNLTITAADVSVGGITASGDLTVDTNTLYVDSTNNRVGIGTTSPGSVFDIQGTAGQLFSVTDSISGTIFAVNDISGVPSIEVLSTGNIKLNEFSGDVLFGTCQHTLGADGEQLKIGYNALCSQSGGLGNVAIGYEAMCSNVSGCYNTAIGHQALLSNTSDVGSYNTAHGYQALYSNTTGEKNTAVGYQSMYSNTTGEYNAAIGTDSLRSNTIGQQNVALGHNSLYCNTTGDGQVAAGYKSLFNNTTGNYNVALGAYNLEYNTTGSYNVSVGYCSLNCNTIGQFNVALGYEVLMSNTTGNNNVGIGYQTLKCNQIGQYNTAIGHQSLFNSTADSNSALGFQALYSNTTGIRNTAVGVSSLRNSTTGTQNTAVGTNSLNANTIGNNNVAVGYRSLVVNTTGNSNTAVGINSLASNTTGFQNTAVGQQSLEVNVSGVNNVAIGHGSLRNSTQSSNVAVGFFSMFSTTTGCCNVSLGQSAGCAVTGNSNIAIGYQSGRNICGNNNIALGANSLLNTCTSNIIGIGNGALQSNTTGTGNLAIGCLSLWCNTTGVQNTAIGTSSLSFTTTGVGNLAIGPQALRNNTIGSRNIAIGLLASGCSTTADNNIAIGECSQRVITTGGNNTTLGTQTMFSSNTTSVKNTMIGAFAGYNTFGDHNTAVGHCAARWMTTGSYNVAIGSNSLFGYQSNVCCNVAIGYRSMICTTSGNNNVAIGTDSLFSNTTSSNLIAIGSSALCSNTIGVGNIAIGYEAMCANVSGNYNTAIGYQALLSNTSDAGSYNTAHGYQALFNNTTGEKNTAIGYQSMYANTTGEYNAAIGTDSLRSNTIGQQNVALGHNSLYCNTTGFGQVAAGYKSLFNNTTGNYNVGLGAYNLECNTIGSCNVAIGYCSLNLNTTAGFNVAVGFEALKNNTTGQYNTGIGIQVLSSNTTGSTNVAVGSSSLLSNTYGDSNVAIGNSSLRSNTTGGCNVAIGLNNLRNNTIGIQNVAVGTYALDSNTTGNDNVAIGFLALQGNQTGIYNVAIGTCSNRTGTGNNNVTIGYNTGWSLSTSSSNVLIGRQAGFCTNTGGSNVMIGTFAGSCNTSGANNLLVGDRPMQNNTTGSQNVALGMLTMNSNVTGSFNVAVGRQALQGANSNCNTAIGHYAGRFGTTGVNNVIVGYDAALSSVTASNEIVLGNSSNTCFRIPGVGFSIDSSCNVTVGGSGEFSGDLTVDTNTLYVDSTNNRVGIGTTSPATQLHISSGTDTDAILRIEADTDNNDEADQPRIEFVQDGGIQVTAIGHLSSNNYLTIANSVATGGIAFATGSSNGFTNATERMFINDSGLVGIGTTSPQVPLHLEFQTPIIRLTDSNGTDQYATIKQDGANLMIMSRNNTGSSGVLIRRDVGGTETDAFQLQSNGDISFYNSAGSSQDLFWDASASRLGIGTTSPDNKLHIQNGGASASSNAYSNLTIESSSSINALQFLSPNTAQQQIRFGDPQDDGNGYIAYNHSGVYLSMGVNGPERLRIDSSGNFLVGTTNTDPAFNNVVGQSFAGTGQIQVTRDGGTGLLVNRKTSNGELVSFRKDSATVGIIGALNTELYLGSDAGSGSYFNFGSNRVIPASSSGGNRDNVIDLGNSASRFDDIFATNGTIQTSDQNEKQSIQSLTASEIAVAKRISKLFKTFKFNSAVEEKGDSARTHTGIIAQDVQQAFTDEGLDASNYALFISSTWWEKEISVDAVAEEIDEEGNVIVEGKDAYTYIDTKDEATEGYTQKTRLGIRYPELLSFVSSAFEQRLTNIETRLTVLENA